MATTLDLQCTHTGNYCSTHHLDLKSWVVVIEYCSGDKQPQYIVLEGSNTHLKWKFLCGFCHWFLLLGFGLILGVAQIIRT